MALLRSARERGEPFDVVVLDYHMPGMDGIEVAREIKADPALSDTILILLTSVTLQLDAAQIKAEGFAGYLVKPAHHSELSALLASALHARKEGKNAPLLTRQILNGNHPDKPSAESYAGVKALVVDDNLINRKVASLHLQHLGCEVETAENGVEAIERIAAKAYDVVFMDVQMPVMDGLEATRELRKRGATVPVIAMTAHAMQGDRERCLASGMNGYVTKPVDGESIGSEMAKVLRAKG
ncbi:MAG: response regulator [Polyangiaceae bacterium]|nr:response regulator [Polyangiaceae bacterium]